MASFVKIEEAAGLTAERDEYLNIDDLVKHDHHDAPVAQKAKLGFKLLLLERLNENLKQKHF